MKQNKMSVMFLATILALAGIGVTYAGFTDAISVYGTVDTATVDINVVQWYSGTWVWKVWGPTYQGSEIYIYHGWVGTQPTTPGQVLALPQHQGATNAELFSWSYAAVGTSHGDPAVPYDVDMVYHNLFPCIDFSADFIFHYDGTIPAKINIAQIFPIDESKYDDSGVGFLTWLWAYHKLPGNDAYGAWVEAYRCYPIYDTAGKIIVGWNINEQQPVDVGYQLHKCNYVYLKLVIHLPQDNNLQGLSGHFGGKIGVIQWNDACVID